MDLSLSPFDSFGPFALVRPIGRGGMGEVYLARTPWPRHPWVALKRLRADVARVPAFVERFRHEALIGTRLEHHGLVATLDVGVVDKQPYVASEWVQGRDVGAISDELRTRSEGGSTAVAVRLLVDTLSTLGYVHQAQDEQGQPLGLIHRDLKPGNLLLGFDGRAKLADFGLAKSFHIAASRLTRQGEILGTPHYLAPEIIRGNPATSKADIYGLGAVIYRFLTGVAPVGSTSSKELMRKGPKAPMPLVELRPDLPPWFISVLNQMLEPNPDHRPEHAEAFAEEVRLLAQNQQIWVESDAVGVWLRQLFEKDYVEENHQLQALEAQVSDTLVHSGGVTLDQDFAAADETVLSQPSPVFSGEFRSSSRLGHSPPPEPAIEALASSVEEQVLGSGPRPRLDIQQQASRASTVLNFEVDPSLRKPGSSSNSRPVWQWATATAFAGLVAGLGLGIGVSRWTGPDQTVSAPIELPWVTEGRVELQQWSDQLDTMDNPDPAAWASLSRAALALAEKDRLSFRHHMSEVVVRAR